MVDLETSKLFRSLSPAELEMLHDSVRIYTFPAEKTIFTEGDEGDGLYLVRDGIVQISAVVHEHERRILSRIGAGDFFGEMAVLDQGPRSATATAEQPTVVYFIPRSTILLLLENSPRLAVSLMREFSLRLREFNRQYIQEVLQAERLALVGRFARAIVHDFKNPLNVIGIAADIAALENSTLEMRTIATARIRKQIDHLSSMINELLEFTRGIRNPVVLAQTDYARFLQRVLDELKPELNECSIRIDYENSPPPIPLLMDPARLVHVLRNLINNAVDAMPEGGTIKLRFLTEGDCVITEMEDTGPGIPLEIAPRLFEAFATYGKVHGTGLGLSICKRIIEDHRGSIEAVSQPGRGAIFRFSLPIPAQSAPTS